MGRLGGNPRRASVVYSVNIWVMSCGRLSAGCIAAQLNPFNYAEPVPVEHLADLPHQPDGNLRLSYAGTQFCIYNPLCRYIRI